MVNCSFGSNTSVPYGNSQFSTVHSHVVMAHCSIAQNFLPRADQGYDADGYCLLANNVFAQIEWRGSEDADLAVTHNHFFAGGLQPALAKHSSSGGDETTLFADASNGDFTPGGDLLASLKKPVVQYDRAGMLRPTNSPAGALA